jgi:hypothetical protein
MSIETISESEKIINNFKKGDFSDFLENFIQINQNNITINYIYFKYFATLSTYELITNLLINRLDRIIDKFDSFIVYLNLKSFSLLDLDKHKNYIYSIASSFKQRYPDKLIKCYIYNTSFLINQVYNILCGFVDKDTLNKIEFINDK